MVKVRSRKVTRIKNSFSGTRHMISSHFCMDNKKRAHFTIWLHASQRQSRAGSTPGHIRSNFITFFRKNVCFWASLNAWFQKCHFYFFAMSRNTQNRSLKNDVINGYSFGLYVCQKIDISTWNLACQMSRHGPITCFAFVFKIWNILDLVKKL